MDLKKYNLKPIKTKSQSRNTGRNTASIIESPTTHKSDEFEIFEKMGPAIIKHRASHRYPSFCEKPQ